MRSPHPIVITLLAVAFAGCLDSGEACGPIEDPTDKAGKGFKMRFVCLAGDTARTAPTEHTFTVSEETTRVEILHHLAGDGTIALSIIDPEGDPREIYNDGVIRPYTEAATEHLFTAHDPGDPLPGEWTLVVKETDDCCVTYHFGVMISSPDR